jgi:hypothetical protein
MVASRSAVLCLSAVFIAGIFPNLTVRLCAQETSNTTTKPKSTVHSLKVDSAEVIYTSGDDAVLKLPDGSLELFELQPGTSLTIDGKPATAADLSPGMTLSHAQLHSRTESEVTTVNEISGIVTQKQGRLLTIRLEDGTSKIYRVPHDATFEVNGQKTKFDDVTKGSRVSITAVKTEGLSTVNKNAAVVAQTPQQSGTLVVER